MVTLGDMFPMLSCDNKFDRCSIDRVLPSQGAQALSVRVSVSNRADLFFQQFVHTVAYAFGMCVGMFTTAVQIAKGCAAFLLRISIVIAASAKKQMVRIHAEPYVATMADAHAGRDWSVRQLVSDPMSQFAPVAAVSSLSGSHNSQPHPADICLSEMADANPEPKGIHIPSGGLKAFDGTETLSHVGPWLTTQLTWACNSSHPAFTGTKFTASYVLWSAAMFAITDAPFHGRIVSVDATGRKW